MNCAHVFYENYVSNFNGCDPEAGYPYSLIEDNTPRGKHVTESLISHGKQSFLML